MGFYLIPKDARRRPNQMTVIFVSCSLCGKQILLAVHAFHVIYLCEAIEASY